MTPAQQELHRDLKNFLGQARFAGRATKNFNKYAYGDWQSMKTAWDGLVTDYNNWLVKVVDKAQELVDSLEGSE